MFQHPLKMIKKRILMKRLFEFKKRQETIAAGSAAEEDARFSQKLSDPNVKSLNHRVAVLGSQLNSFARTTQNTAKIFQNKTNDNNKSNSSPKRVHFMDVFHRLQ